MMRKSRGHIFGCNRYAIQVICICTGMCINKYDLIIINKYLHDLGHQLDQENRINLSTHTFQSCVALA
ncbi:MAG: hypothetical protein ABFD57_09050 [Smithella sp.]